MPVSVLIASPTIAFGELIRLTLEGEGNFHASRVSTGCDALAQCQSTPFTLAILDADLDDLPLLDLFTAIQKLCPGIRLILVPPHNDPKSSTVADLSVDGYLSKPFYLPDLMNIVNRALRLPDRPEETQPAVAASKEEVTLVTPSSAATLDGESPSPPPSKPIVPTAPAWLQDVVRAAQHLTRLSLETAALAALILRDGELWAYAGQLTQPAAQELARTVAHYWERGNGSDLARFVHLNATDGDYMLYATAVSRDMALAMVFDIEMPFSKIRSQASHLARALTSPPGMETHPPAQKESSQPAISSTGTVLTDSEETLNLAGLTPLFDDVPPAMPDNLSPSLAPAVRKPVSVQPLSPSATRLEAHNRVQPQIPQPEEMQPETFLTHLPEETPQDILEPASPAICYLSYACLLIPRMPQHAIEGDLAKRLPVWTQQLCFAYGWRLERLVVDPEYVEWVMIVSPTTSPSSLMRLFRQHTSARIFADFPVLRSDNPSGDFWAPGYLIMSSSRLPPESLVKDFIRQTRRRQGVSQPLDNKKSHG